MLRPATLLLSLAALAGCTTTTHLVGPSDPAAVAGAHLALAGRVADIDLATGERARGRVQYVRTDTTAWTEADLLWTVPTAGVRALTVDDRARSVGRGALIGTGVGLSVGLLALASANGQEDEVDRAVSGVFALFLAVAAVPTGAVYGAAGGALVGRRVEYVFAGPPDGPPGVPPGVPPGADVGPGAGAGPAE